MKRSFSLISAAAALIVLTGCSSFPVGQYAPSDANRESLLRTGTTAKIQVKSFSAVTPGVTKISCRAAGNMNFPGGESVETYLANALRKDLTYAGLHADTAPLTITGKVNLFDMNSNVLNAGWEFDVSISNGSDEFRIKHLHRVKTSWAAERACAAVAAQMVEATQELNRQIMSNPKFLSWLKGA